MQLNITTLLGLYLLPIIWAAERSENILSKSQLGDITPSRQLGKKRHAIDINVEFTEVIGFFKENPIVSTVCVVAIVLGIGICIILCRKCGISFKDFGFNRN